MKILTKISVLVIILMAAIFLGVYTLSTPAVKGIDEPVNNFSALRAMIDIEAISRNPHPIGSQEHDTVRDYIIQKLSELGTNPSIEKGFVENKLGSKDYTGNPENIIAKLKGTDKTGKTILLMAHYDTKSGCPGASDDSMGCAVLLETLRALCNSKPLKNDVNFIFTDSEESGLLGSKLYYSNLVKDKVDITLNFEARGNSGPSLMFETSKNNQGLINEFKKSVSYPIAFSFSNTLYSLMPNYTDFSIFKKEGLINGYNFALVGGLDTYHKKEDTADNIDQRSIQHAGTYALELARHFGNLTENPSSENNSVYFTASKHLLVVYSEKYAVLFSAFSVLLLMFIIFIGIRKKMLMLKGVIKGAAALLIISILVAVSCYIIWILFKLGYEKFSDTNLTIHTVTSLFSVLLFILFSVLTILLVFIFYRKAAKYISLLELIIGSLSIWSIIAVTTSIWLAGLSYLFTWTLIFTTLGLGLIIIFDGRIKTAIKLFGGFALFAISMSIILFPLMYLTYMAFSIFIVYIHMVIITLILSILIPYIMLVVKHNTININRDMHVDEVEA